MAVCVYIVSYMTVVCALVVWWWFACPYRITNMSVSEVHAALQGLQHDAQRRREFNNWLEQFQRSPGAWSVTGEVLHSPSAARELKIFCAQTLRNKAAYDLHQVPAEARLPLKTQIIDLLEVNSALLNVVGVHLCVALAALAMQMLEWQDPVQEIVAKLDNPQMVPLLFEFLRVLPEEFHSKRAGLVNPAVVLERSTQVIQNNAYTVMEHILNRAELMAQTSDTQALFFGALKPWLQEVQLDDIMASPLVPWMLQSFASEEARAPAVDCLVIVLNETHDIYEPNVQRAIQRLYPEIMQLATPLLPSMEDEDIHRELTRLLAQAALAWHVLISKDPTFFPLLDAVAQCVAVPETELTTLELTFPFFERLKLMIGESLPTENRSSSPEKREPFRALFIQLLAHFVRYLEIPPNFPDRESEDVFREFRYDIGDMLKVCSGIAGHEQVLQWFAAELGSPKSVANAEALLFGVRSIARTVPTTESTWVPKIFDAVFRLPCLDSESVQHAAVMLLGRYSQWATGHHQYLPMFLDQILQAAWSPFAEVRRASAHAFLYFASDAAYELGTCLPQILEFYTKLGGECELDSFINYSDGVGFVLNNLAVPVMTEAISTVFTPVTSQCSAVTSAESAIKLGHLLQGLGSIVGQIDIFKSENEINREHPLYLAVMATNELFTETLRDLGSKHKAVAEGVARYYIKVLFNLTGSMQPALPSLLASVYQILSVNPLLPVLYELASTISQCYSAYVPPNEIMDQAVWLFLQQTCSVLFAPEVSQLIERDGEREPEDSPILPLVYQGFHLLCDVAVYFPVQFLSSLLEKSIILSGHVLRFCYDQDSLAAVGHFYDDVKSLLSAHSDLVKRGFEQSGMVLLRSLFFWFMAKPDSYFEPRAEGIVDLVFQLVPQSAFEWLNAILSDLPEGTTNEQEVTQFLGQVFQDVTNPMARGVGMDLNRFVQAYAARNYDPRL